MLYQMAACLRDAGFDVRAVPREGDGPTPYQDMDVPILAWEDLKLTPEDIWLVPEGWVNALAPGLNAGARCVVYCQNWAYLFSSLPPDVRWSQLRVSFLAVSHPVAWYIKQALGIEAPPILRPGIDQKLFTPTPKSSDDVLRIAWMPRKNKALGEQIRAMFESRQSLRPNSPQIHWLEIAGLDSREVARVLRESHIFLATGFPEGCPLPPLEAMACGCLPVGFGGLGGWDYMRQAQPNGYQPWWPLRPDSEAPWGGNGLWTADADVAAAALALEQAVDWWRSNDPNLKTTLNNCRATAAHYTPERQQDSITQLWTQAAARRLFM